MATAAAPGTPNRVVRIWQTTIGKKAIMAVTGLILFGFVFFHMLGNLQIYAGPAKINAYAAFLRGTPALLWGTRVVLLVSVVLHLGSAFSLTAMSKAARPKGYRMRGNVSSSYASRTMIWGGLILLAFIVYHLLHFTTGQAHPSFVEGDVYHNVVTGFRQIPAAASYIVAMLFLGMHLHHGVYSMFQSLGLTHPQYTPRIRAFAALFAFLITAGNISMPVAVLAGVIK